MYPFETYTLVVYQTPPDYYCDVPEHRFVAYLKEIPEASLHEYGDSHETAIINLRLQFEDLVQDSKERQFPIPPPDKRDEEYYSGKMVVRMPAWLHKRVAEHAGEQGISINSYMVNRLITESTFDEVIEKITSRQKEIIEQLSYQIQQVKSEMKITDDKASMPKILTVNDSNREYKYKKVGGTHVKNAKK
jgi:predicted HicB family RNase H-like nuclease